MDGLFFQFFHVTVVDFFSDRHKKSGFHGILFFHSLNLCKRSYFCNFCKDIFIMRRCDLRTILPVNFVSIVFSWVMACCDHNSWNTAKFTDCKWKLRCRAKAVKHISPDSVCIQAECCLLGKFRRHNSGIMSDRNTFFLSVLGNDIICKPLSRLSYRIDIHTVRSCSDHSAESPGSKLKLTVETVLDLCLIVPDCF